MEDLEIHMDEWVGRMKQGRAETTWWVLRTAEERDIHAIVVIYVDDFTVLAPKEVIDGVAQTIQKVWKASTLQVAQPGSPIRFLGMTVHAEGRSFYLSQEDYVSEMIRIYGITREKWYQVPISKEQCAFSILPTDEPPTDELVKKAQKLSGEVLWLANRTRPDVGFASAVLSSICTRAPVRACSIGMKVMGYVAATKDYKLKIVADETGLNMYCDASFAPEGERSHSGWVITYAGTPLSWRSGRQPTVSLSTAEAELAAALEGGVALLGAQALLTDLDEVIQEKVIYTDSTNALAISEGSGSWRTRHLRVKAQWLAEMIRDKELVIRHCPGRDQLADLLTKPMPATRIKELIELWGCAQHDGGLGHGDPATAAVTTTAANTAAARVLAFMILLCSVVKGESTGVETYQPPYSLRVDRTLVSWAFIVGIAALLILGWELIRWAGVQTFDRFGPASTERRLRRLQRLREQTAQAIGQELRTRELVDPVPPPEPVRQQWRTRFRDAARALDDDCGQRVSARSATVRPGFRSDRMPQGSFTEGGSSGSRSAVPTLGVNAREEVVRRETAQKDVQALVGIQYMPPPPVKEIHIEQIVYQGPYYVGEGGGGDCVHTYANCWGSGTRELRPSSYVDAAMRMKAEASKANMPKLHKVWASS